MEDDDEFAAFQAEMAKMSDAPKPMVTQTIVAGPRAPKVISAAPSGPSAPETAPPPPAASLKQEQSSSLADEQAMPSEAAPDPEAAESMGLRNFSMPGSSLAPPPGEARAPPQQFHMGGAPIMAGGAVVPPPPPPPKPASGKEKAAEKEKAPITQRFCAGAAWEDKTLADWPEDDFRIFVGDLGNETNDDVLAHAFARYPSFQKARVVRNKNTQKSMGYGFVSFKDPWDMTKSLREMHGKYIGNRPVKVRKSSWKERSATDKEWNHSLAVTDKKEIKKHTNNPKMKKQHVNVKKKGMPW